MSSPGRIDGDGAPAVKRGPRRSAGPIVSVVVTSNRDKALLHTCLNSLARHCQRLNVDLVVARAGGSQEVAALAKAYPFARFVTAPSDASIPQLRATGMRHAHGDIVTLTDDHAVSDETAVEAWLQLVNGAYDAR